MSIKLKKEEEIEVIVIDDESSVEASGVEVVRDEVPLPQEEAHLLPIPKGTIPDTLKFHPGCNVVCMQGQEESPLISFGTVLYVLFDLSTLKYLYKIHPHPTGDPFLVEECRLHFAQGSPVWAKLSPREAYVEALILSAEKKQQLSRIRFQAASSAIGAVNGNLGVIYSVIRPTHPGIIYGIPENHIKYRPEGSMKPTDDEENGDVHKVGERIKKACYNHSMEPSSRVSPNNTRLASFNGWRSSERSAQISSFRRLHNADFRAVNKEKSTRDVPQEKSRPTTRTSSDTRVDLQRESGGGPNAQRECSDEPINSPAAKRRRLPSTNDPPTMLLSIPKSTEYSAVISAVEKGDLLQHAIRLNIRLSIISQKREIYPFLIKLTGPSCAFAEFTHLVKAEVVKSAEKGDQVRVMYEFDLANVKHDVKNDNGGRPFVTVIKPPLFHMKAYVSIQWLPRQAEILAEFIGKRGDKIEEMNKQTNCTVTVVQEETKLPHVRVLGSNANDVMSCIELVRDRLHNLSERKDARSGRHGEGTKKGGENSRV